MDGLERRAPTDVDTYLARAPDAERAALAGEIATFLALAPTPDYDEAALAAIGAEPAVARRRDRARTPGGLWAAAAPAAARAGGTLTGQLAARLVAALGLGADRERKTRGYLEQLEAERSSRAACRPGSLLDGLARVLEVPRGALEGRGRARRPARPRALPGRGRGGRGRRGPISTSSPTRSPRRPGGAWDDVDELFRGGARRGPAPLTRTARARPGRGLPARAG